MKIVLISCVKRKQPLAPGQTVPAKELYTSPLFQKAWAYAQTLHADRIYILSAKHGLLDPNTPTATYDETLTNASTAQRQNWTARVLRQMTEAGLDIKNDHFVVLAGKAYNKYLLGKNGLQHYELPYQNCQGIGYVLQFLCNQLKNTKTE